MFPSPPSLLLDLLSGLLPGLLSGRGASRYVAVASVTSPRQMVPTGEARGDGDPPQMGREGRCKDARRLSLADVISNLKRSLRSCCHVAQNLG